MNLDDKVEVDLGVEGKPTAQTELEEAKKEPSKEFVDTMGHDLWMLFAVGIFVFGAFSFYLLENSLAMSVSDLNVSVSDANFSEEHLALAGNQSLILQSLSALQVQHLCGVNLLVVDSNRLIENEEGSFVTYSCYARVGVG